MIEKEQLRKHFKLVRQAIENRQCKESTLTDKLYQMTRNLKSVFCYVSFGSEMSTHNYIEKMLSSNVVVGVPHTVLGTMKCRKLISYKSLLADNAGNLIDAELGDEFIAQAAIVPLLSFNNNCFRLGYGGGYYDRYLKENRIKSIGIAFDEQFCDKLIVEPFDVALDVILTPLSVRRAK